MRKKVLIILGYVLFFLFSFILSLYLTFDPLPIKSFIENSAQKKGWQVEIAHLKKYRLSGIKAFEVYLKQKNSQQVIKIDQLVARLNLFPLITGKMKIKLLAMLYGGKIKGVVERKAKAFYADIAINSINLSRMRAEQDNGFWINSLLSGKVKLALKNPSEPRSWQGNIRLSLKGGEIPDFSFQTFQVPAVKIQSAKLELEIKNGKAQIKTIELKSPDFPISLSGEMELRIPLTRSILNLKGRLEPSEEYIAKIPLIKTVLSPDKTFNYRGTLSALVGTF